MLKTILNLEGAQQLSKNEQKSIHGGKAPLCCMEWHPVEEYCGQWNRDCCDRYDHC